jgi:CheY-like chemotaxis protein
MTSPRAPLPRRFETPREAVLELFRRLEATGEKVLVVEDSETDLTLFRHYFEHRSARRGIQFEFASLSAVGVVDIDSVIHQIDSRSDIWAIVLDLALRPEEDATYAKLSRRNIVDAWKTFDREPLEQQLTAFQILSAARALQRSLPVAVATRYARFDSLVRILNLYGVVGVVQKGEFGSEWESELDLFLLQARHEVEQDRVTSEFLLVGHLVSHGAKNLLNESFAKLEELEGADRPVTIQDLRFVRARLSTLQARLAWHLDEIPRVITATRKRGGPIRGWIELVPQVQAILEAPYKAWGPYAKSLGIKKAPDALGVYTYQLLLLLVIEEIVLNTQRHLEAAWELGRKAFSVWAELHREGDQIIIAICHNGPPALMAPNAPPSNASGLGVPLIHSAEPLLGASWQLEGQRARLAIPQVLGNYQSHRRDER